MFARAIAACYRLMLPDRAKNTLRVHLTFEERDKPPPLVAEFPERSVVVLAPHMDDEVIGCGGAVRRHVLAGARVTVVFLTDGRQDGLGLYAGSGLTPAQVRDAGDQLVATRRGESERAAAILGVGELVFLDGQDGALESDERIVAGLAEVLERVRPELVYLPSLLDTHLDHWMTNVVYLACLERAGTGLAGCRMRQYEVWTPLIPNLIIDIESVLGDKTRALEQFESQLPLLDVVGSSLALARYRSIYHAAGRGAAEAFWESGVDGYRAVFERYRALR